MTTKETLILKIIQGYSPQHLEYNILYDLQRVKEICAIVWDTANNEIDEICELKADKEVLEQKIEELKAQIEELEKQHEIDLEAEYQKGRDEEESYRLDLNERYS